MTFTLSIQRVLLVVCFILSIFCSVESNPSYKDFHYEVQLDHSDYQLHFANLDCTPDAVASAWLQRHVAMHSSEDLKALVREMEKKVPAGASKVPEKSRSCGWTFRDGVVGRGFSGTSLMRDHRLRFASMGSGQKWWSSALDDATDGWLHIDMEYPLEISSGEVQFFDFVGVGDGQPTVSPEHITTLRHNCTELPMFEDGAFEHIYSEHLMEHLKPAEAVATLAEWWRLAKPGGIIRITMPDLEKFMAGYNAPKSDGGGFLERHIDAYPEQLRLPWELPGRTSRATLINDIFRNWDHDTGWLWDEDSFREAFTKGAGLPTSSLKRSMFRDPSLPAPLQNRDAPERAHESMYFNIYKN